MKKTRIVLIAIVLGLLGAMTWYIVRKVGKATAEYQRRTTLPDFKFSQFSGLPYTQDSLPAATPLVLMLFDPDCSHCQEEIGHIQSTLPAFVGTQLLLVSPADRSRVIPFSKERGLDTLPGVRVLLTEAKDFEAAFGQVKTPSTFFYGADGALREDFYGKVQPEGLKKGLDKIKP